MNTDTIMRLSAKARVHHEKLRGLLREVRVGKQTPSCVENAFDRCLLPGCSTCALSLAFDTLERMEGVVCDLELEVAKAGVTNDAKMLEIARANRVLYIEPQQSRSVWPPTYSDDDPPNTLIWYPGAVKP